MASEWPEHVRCRPTKPKAAVNRAFTGIELRISSAEYSRLHLVRSGLNPKRKWRRDAKAIQFISRHPCLVSVSSARPPPASGHLGYWLPNSWVRGNSTVRARAGLASTTNLVIDPSICRVVAKYFSNIHGHVPVLYNTVSMSRRIHFSLRELVELGTTTLENASRRKLQCNTFKLERKVADNVIARWQHASGPTNALNHFPQ